MILNSQMRNSLVNNLLTLYKTFLISCPANHTAVKFPFPSVVKKKKKKIIKKIIIVIII